VPGGESSGAAFRQSRRLASAPTSRGICIHALTTRWHAVFAGLSSLFGGISYLNPGKKGAYRPSSAPRQLDFCGLGSNRNRSALFILFFFFLINQQAIHRAAAQQVNGPRNINKRPKNL